MTENKQRTETETTNEATKLAEDRQVAREKTPQEKEGPDKEELWKELQEALDKQAALEKQLEARLSGSSRGIPYIWGYGIIGEKSRRLCYAEHYGSQITRHDFNSFGYS